MFVDLMGHMIIQTELADDKKQQFVKGVIDLMSDSNSQLKHHQNTNIYKLASDPQYSINNIISFVNCK